MSYLSQDEADRIITTQELVRLGPIVEQEELAIRCNHGNEYTGGDGFNLESDTITILISSMRQHSMHPYALPRIPFIRRLTNIGCC